MAAKLDVTVVVVGAPEDMAAMKAVAERLGKEGLGGRMELIPGTEVERMGQIVDSYPGRTLFIALESVAFPKPLVRRLEGVFGARRGPDQRLVAVALDPRVPLAAMPPIRAAVAEYAVPGASAALSRTGAASVSRREAVPSRARSGPQARARTSGDSPAAASRADLMATARFPEGSTSLDATGEFSAPETPPRADLAATRRMGPATKPEPVASAATSLTASQQLLSTRRLAMSEESNPWEDETKPLTASTRLARTPPGVELDSTVAERSKSGGRTSSRRLAIDEAEKFVETERRSWRVVVLGALGVVTLATVAIAFFMTDGFGTLPRADTDAEGAARTRPRTSALDEPAGEPGARPGGKGMTTKLQPGPGAAAVPPGQAPGGATTEPPPSDAAGEVRPGAAGTGDLDLPVLAAPPPAPPAPSNDAHGGAAAGAASGPSSAPSDGVLDPRVVTAAIEAGELHVLDLMLVAPALAATKFDVAVSLCRTRDIRGIDGFRLPTIKELQRLRKARMIRPSHVYWSGDPSKSGERAVLEDGAVRRVEPSGLAKVVCVRSQ